MQHRSHSKKLHKNQEGALLLIALVLLGVIVLSTVYLSLVLLSEIKSTRYTDNGIVSHYVAESGIENALWKLKLAKQDGVPSEFTDLGLSPLATGQCAAEQDINGVCGDPERMYDYNKVAIAAPDYTAYNIPKNTIFSTDIYNPSIEGSSGDTGIEGAVNMDWYLESCSGSDDLETTYTPINISNLAVEQTRTQVDVCRCSSESPPYGYDCERETIGDISKSKFYRFTFRSLDQNVKKFSMTASANIPSQVEIQSTGTYRESQKKITARTLWLDALSGIFGFVVFSEQSLIKDAKSLTGAAYGSRCGFCSFSNSTTKSGCSTNTDCQQCVSGKCLDGTTNCPMGTECNSFTCGIVNTTSDTVDAAATTWFCPLENNLTSGEKDSSPINQTNAGLCNALCNGYTFCGDGTIQSPNGAGTDGDNDSNPGNAFSPPGKGFELCDAGSANSNTLPLSCRADCRLPYCGDGVTDNGIMNNAGTNVTYSEECDDKNASDSDLCYSPANAQYCKFTICGDNIIQNPNGHGIAEQCDGSALGICPPVPGCSPSSCTCL